MRNELNNMHYYETWFLEFWDQKIKYVFDNARNFASIQDYLHGSKSSGLYIMTGNYLDQRKTRLHSPKKFQKDR